MSTRPVPIAPLRTYHPAIPRDLHCPEHGPYRDSRDVCPRCEAAAMHRMRFHPHPSTTQDHK